jgi:ABC-type transport system involved in multi-copper enzyme maturation permease subunit
MSTEFVTIDKTRPGIPMTRLIKVELRKLVDTRAGRWLLITIGVICALVTVIVAWVALAHDDSLAFGDFTQLMGVPMALLLPILGIMAVTSEWTQRTGLVTFTLEPRRGNIVAAKLSAGIITALASVLLALAVAVIGTVLFAALDGSSADWSTPEMSLGGFALNQVIGLATGFAFGTLIVNTAAAIVAYVVYMFVLPGLFAWAASGIGWFDKIHPWIDFRNAQGFLYEGSVTGRQWAEFATSGLIWFVLPLTIGIWRLLKSEVK